MKSAPKPNKAANPLFLRLRWPLRLTWAGIVGDRFLKAFWPSFSLIFGLVAALLFGLHEILPLIVVYGALAALAAVLLVFLARGIAKFRFPSRAEVRARLDETLAGQPLAALADAQTVGADDPASRAVWQAHLARMEAKAQGARAPIPDFKLRDRDPNGLRLMAVVALLTALLFGAPKHFRSVPILADNLIAGTNSAGALWEGWIQPPSYTGKPNLYLNDLTDRDQIMVPEGSQISMRFYTPGAAAAFEQSVGTLPPVGQNEAIELLSVTVENSGRLAITGNNGADWRVVMLPDDAPEIEIAAPLEATLNGELKQEFEAKDDYGVVKGEVQFSLDLEAVDRRFGLMADPDPRDTLVLDLPLPYSTDTSIFTETISESFADHPWAGLTVTMGMQVEDDLAQVSTFAPLKVRLPKRKFFHPLAASVVEMRRDILWARSNSLRAEQVLRAVTHHPEGIEMDRSGFLMLRVALNRLSMANVDGMDAVEQEMIADALWAIALRFEEGGLEDAKARLERAQDRLAEAMERGAGDEEIAELMEELRKAMDDYMQQLANNADPNAEEQSAQNQESSSITQDEIDALMDQIQDLMEQGRMAEAQQLLDMLREMMENMQVTQGSGGDGPQTPGEQALEGLQDTLRDQQELSDESFRNLQEQYNPPDPQDGQNPSGQGEDEGSEGEGATGEGQSGEGGGEGEQETGRGQPGGQQSLEQRQEALREALRRQENGMPSDGDGGAGEALERAGRAMEEAADALGNEDIPLALDRQSQAIEELREGMRSLGQALAENEGSEGEEGQSDQAQGRNGGDPLGREAGTAGTSGSQSPLADGESPYGRARELLDELRRREGDKTRPDQELEYLRRLMDEF